MAGKLKVTQIASPKDFVRKASAGLRMLTA